VSRAAHRPGTAPSKTYLLVSSALGFTPAFRSRHYSESFQRSYPAISDDVWDQNVLGFILIAATNFTTQINKNTWQMRSQDYS
jgi:hypothetical protein